MWLIRAIPAVFRYIFKGDRGYEPWHEQRMDYTVERMRKKQ